MIIELFSESVSEVENNHLGRRKSADLKEVDEICLDISSKGGEIDSHTTTRAPHLKSEMSNERSNSP